jgi:hypothetical protein
MRFNIVGADKDTGEPIEMAVEATDEAAVHEVAHRKGIMVSRITPALATRPAATRHVAATQPLEPGHIYGAPVINIAAPRRGSSLGIASLVLGILAFLICWIPFVNLLGVPLSGLGLLLGLIGVLVALTRKGSSIGFPIAGAAVCALALFIAVGMTGAVVGGVSKAAEGMAEAARQRNATNQTTGGSATPAALLGPDGAASTAVGENGAPSAQQSWAPASQSVVQGDIEVRVLGARVGKVSIRDTTDNGKSESKDPMTSIDIELTNISKTKKTSYTSWRSDSMTFGSSVALTDNFDNGYAPVGFGLFSEPVGGVRSESMYPGKSVRDVIVFEPPVPNITYLNLELDASRFGGEGKIRIRIPDEMIVR